MSRLVRRHPALIARILTVGVSAAATAGIVTLLARSSDRAEPIEPNDRTIEVRIGNEVGDDEARAALRAWLEGQPDLTDDAELTIVDAPPDTVSAPS